MRSTTAMSWLMNNSDRPNSSCSPMNRLMTCAWIVTSSALTASSAMIIRGFRPSARAMQMR